MKDIFGIFIFPQNNPPIVEVHLGDNIKITLEDSEEIQTLINSLITLAQNHKTPEELLIEEEKNKNDLYFKLLVTNVSGIFTDEEILEKVEAFEDWSADAVHKFNEYYNYEGILYKVISKNLDTNGVDQGFTSQADWTPDVAVSLYTPILPPGVIDDWKAPTGAEDTYQTGDKVVFEGQIYECLIDNNSWSPIDYPQGWTLVESA